MMSRPEDVSNDSFVGYQDLSEYVGLSNIKQGFYGEPNRSSHLGIHKQTNACWSLPRSQMVFYHFKSAESGN